MCTDWIMDDVLGFDPPKPTPTASLDPFDGKAPSKSSAQIQEEEEKERARRAASTTGLAALSKITGGLGDADFSSVKRVTLG